MYDRIGTIKISDNKIFITKSDFFTLDQTNFPNVNFSFRRNRDLYWKVEITNYDKESKLLQISVIDYDLTDLSTFEGQLLKNRIAKLEFINLEWPKLERCLSCFQHKALLDILREDDRNEFWNKINTRKKELDEIEASLKNNRSETATDKNNKEEIEDEVLTIEHRCSISCLFVDAEFKQGYISIFNKFDFVDLLVELKIYNDNILPQFNHIKNYFPKVFNNEKRFEVNVVIKARNNEVLSVSAMSPQISNINNELIDSIKLYRTLSLTGLSQEPDDEDSLLTADDIFSFLDDVNDDDNVLNPTDEEIINLLLNNKDIRNKKQLEYLAGSMHNSTEKLRYTLKPNFGFLFFIERDENIYFCWELLNSHATYLWNLPKKDYYPEKLKEVQNAINYIREQGRNKYKRAYREDILNSDLIFNLIIHKNSRSDMKVSFINWKQKLNELLF
jgi:hypothetical protein